MKYLLTLLTILLVFTTYSQNYENLKDVGTPIFESQHYVRNTTRLMWAVRDTMYFRLYAERFQVNYLNSTRNDGAPLRLLHTDSDGNFLVTPLTSIYFADTAGTIGTKSWVNSRGFITTELDPVWLSEKNNYYTKLQSDARYLQSFVEADPIYNASAAASVSNVKISNWDAAFGWGNHSTQGYLKGLDTVSLSNRINLKFNIPSGTGSQYITGTGSLATFPAIPSAQINSDWNSVSGVSQILNKPVLSTIATTGLFSDVLSKPTTLIGYGITDAYPLTGNPSGFITSITSGNVISALGYTPYNSTNPSNYITSAGAPVQSVFGRTGNIIAQSNDYSFSQIGSKPTTISGYGITDVYTTTQSDSRFLKITNNLSDVGNAALARTNIGAQATITTGTTAQYFRGDLSLATFPSVGVYYNNSVVVSSPKIETLSGTVSGGGGNAVFYLTDNGLVTGNALYTNVNYINPIVNDATNNYTYGYTVSADKKTLTVNIKGTPQLNIALLGITLLGVPANVSNGTAVTVLVVGN